MCGILVTRDPKKTTIESVKRRGLDSQNIILNKELFLLSSVLHIRSTVPQPIVTEKFIFLYNGEIYNNEKSDTLFIKQQIDESLVKPAPLTSRYSYQQIFSYQDKPNNPLSLYSFGRHPEISNLLRLDEERVLDISHSIYNCINTHENEMALVVLFDNYVVFFKDDCGRKSLGMKLDKFEVSSIGYDQEIDNMFIYIYNRENGHLYVTCKKSAVIDLYLENISTIQEFLFDRSYFEVFKHMHLLKTFYADTTKNIGSALNKRLTGDDSIFGELVALLESEDIFLGGIDNFSRNFKSYDHESCIKLYKEIVELDLILQHSFRDRLFAGGDIYIAFSGGIDSVLMVLYLSKVSDPTQKIFLVNTGFPNSFDRNKGIAAYEWLKSILKNDLTFVENNISTDLIKDKAKDIWSLIYPKHGKMDFNISAVHYFTAQYLSHKTKVVYIGSGADELFGGYNKYKTNDFFTNHMLFDTFTMSYHNFTRDERVFANFNVEARYPFFDRRLVLKSFAMDQRFFIFGKVNKLALRILLCVHGCKVLAIIAKKAVQYGSGIFKHEGKIHEEKEVNAKSNK